MDRGEPEPLSCVSRCCAQAVTLEAYTTGITLSVGFSNANICFDMCYRQPEIR